MKKLFTSLLIIFTLTTVFAGGVFAAMTWSGSQDVQQAKDKIVQITDLFRNKNEKIKQLENEKKDFNKQLDNFNKQLDEKNKVIADKDKVIADKEREKVQLQNTLAQKENKIIELERVIDELEGKTDNKVKELEEQLDVAKKDVQELNRLLGDVVNANK